MTKRQIVILAVIAGVLLVAIFIKKLYKPAEYRQPEMTALDVKFSKEAVDHVVIEKMAEPDAGTETEPAPESDGGASDQNQIPVPERRGVELNKASGEWFVPELWNAKVDVSKIEQLFESLEKLEGELRGSSESLFDDFGIKDAQALHIKLMQGSSEQVHLLVGEKKASWQDYFVRKAASEKVYLSTTRLLSNLGIYGDVSEAQLNPDYWVDLTVFDLTADQVKSVSWKGEGEEWHEIATSLPFEADSAKLQNFYQSLVGLHMSGVVDPSQEDYGFAQPYLEARLDLKQGEPVHITVGAVKKDATTDRYVRASTRPEVFYATQYVIDKIKADESQFIKTNPLEVDDDQVELLIVHAPEREYTVKPKEQNWDGLKAYLNALKTLSVSSLVLSAESSIEGKYWLEVQSGGSSKKIACDAPQDEKTSEALCINTQNNIAFKIRRPAFESIFQNLSRLEAPQDAPVAEVAGTEAS